MTSTPLLEVSDLDVRYGPTSALRGTSIVVAAGETHTILGANGAGKSSLARACSGLVKPAGGQVIFDGKDVTGWPAHKIRRAGLIYLPEGRGILPGLSVIDNLRMAVGVFPRRERKAGINTAFELFPVLSSRQQQRAGALSGGEQQMLSLARALAVPPKLIVADELSLGLAPIIVDTVFETIAKAKAMNVTIVLIEQFVHRALAISDRCTILRRGSVAWTGAASAAADELLSHYMGEQVAETELAAPADS
jgi:branched-chain amino acid transport system ATP-binding protein